jgi:hypothetical protein
MKTIISILWQLGPRLSVPISKSQWIALVVAESLPAVYTWLSNQASLIIYVSLMNGSYFT